MPINDHAFKIKMIKPAKIHTLLQSGKPDPILRNHFPQNGSVIGTPTPPILWRKWRGGCISKLFLKIVDLFCPISTWCLLPTCGINTFSTSVLTCPFPSSENSISGHYFQVLKTVFPSYFWKYLICFVQFLLDVCCQLVGLTRFQQVS